MKSSGSSRPPLIATETLGEDGAGNSSLPRSTLFPMVFSFKSWTGGGCGVVFNVQLIFCLCPAVKWLFFLTEEICDV